MEKESNVVGVPDSFQSGQGFPGIGSTDSEEEGSEGYPYPYEVMRPHPVEHSFDQPPEPNPPEGRGELEQAFKQYVKWVLIEYDLEIEWDRLSLKVDGRMTNAMGNCGGDGYHSARVKLSTYYFVERGWGWNRCKHTIRHELVHAWQKRWLGYVSHGPTFREKALELDVENTERYEGEQEPRYVAHCQSCGATYKRYRECEAVRSPYYRCGECNKMGSDVDIEEPNVWVVWDNTDWHQVME